MLEISYMGPMYEISPIPSMYEISYKCLMFEISYIMMIANTVGSDDHQKTRRLSGSNKDSESR